MPFEISKTIFPLEGSCGQEEGETQLLTYWIKEETFQAPLQAGRENWQEIQIQLLTKEASFQAPVQACQENLQEIPISLQPSREVFKIQTKPLPGPKERFILQITEDFEEKVSRYFGKEEAGFFRMRRTQSQEGGTST